MSHKTSGFNKFFFIIFFIFIFLFFLSLFFFYRKQELKNNINKIIIKFNKESKSYQIDESFKINISKNPFSNKIEIKNFQIQIADSLSQEIKLNFPVSILLKEIIFADLELKTSLDNKIHIKTKGLNEILYNNSKNLKIKNFFEFDSEFEIKIKKNNSGEKNLNKNFADLIEIFKYKDQKLKIFNEEKKLIYDTDLFNHLEISNKKDCNFFIDIKKNKLIPFNFLANISEEKLNDAKKIIYKINNLKFDILESKIDLTGEVFVFADQILNETQDFFPEGFLKISIKHLESVLYFFSFFAEPEQIQEIQNFIDQFSIKTNDEIYFEYKKEKNAMPKLNEKEFLENFDYKKIFNLN